ncbi:CIC11C00000003549 [Sungouiella intermedia]|uniref:AP complex subunit beta n=1 Tax=Sungouiella intermedia TaxID=45354 RepID=A0A1L0BXW8_9ASCO|nr:CIC11C00000003549 [[Candida] intermedia]
MSDSKYFVKCKASELRAELEQACKKLKPQPRIKVVLKKVVANIILNKSELASLMLDIVELMAVDDYEIRRLCSQYVVHFAALNVKPALFSLNFYARFSEDHNPALRALAVKTTTSVNLKEFINMGFSLVKRLLQDKNPHVRTAAAFSVARLFQYDQNRTVSEGLVDDLNELLYDENQMVVMYTLAALNSITESSSTLNLAIDKNHSLTLTKGLANANEWRQVYLLNALMAFVPQTTQEALTLLEAILPCLKHENSAVVLNATKVIVYLSNYIRNPEHVFPSLAKRLGSSLVSLLYKPYEVQFLVLRNVILILLGKRYLLDVEVEQFFWKFDDPVYVKDTKLEIIYLLADESNVGVVFGELEEYATEVDVHMARKAIRAFGNLAVKLEVAASQCVEILIDLISHDIPYVVQEVAIVLKNILRKYPGMFDYAIPKIALHYELMDEPDAKVAICWIIGQYSEKLPIAEQALNYFVQTFSEVPTEVQYAIITAVVKFYIELPVKGEPLVLKVLKHATEESDNPDLRDRGYFYWRMITNEANGGTDGDFQKLTKEVVINVDPLITSESDNIDPTILEELELSIGTLASIYLKSVHHVFRLWKRRLLPGSPALQPRRKSAPPIPTNRATNQALEVPRSHRHKPLPMVQRNNSSASYLTNRSSPALHEFENEFAKKPSLGQKLSRKASQITSRKNSKH